MRRAGEEEKGERHTERQVRETWRARKANETWKGDREGRQAGKGDRE